MNKVREYKVRIQMEEMIARWLQTKNNVEVRVSYSQCMMMDRNVAQISVLCLMQFIIYINYFNNIISKPMDT